MKAIPLTLAAFVLALTPASWAGSITVDFEDLPLSANSFYNGAPANPTIGVVYDGSFVSRGAYFNNQFQRSQFGSFVYDSWSGWSYSNLGDTSTPGFGNQYSSFAGGGFGNTGNFGVAFVGGPNGSFINLPNVGPLVGLDVRLTNTTYAALSILRGDQFARPFGPGDYFYVTVTGYTEANATGAVVGSVDFYLADYRGGRTYLARDWELLDLGSLKEARSLGFQLTSSDVGMFGMNTPAYFALDNLRLLAAVPEPSSVVLTVLGLGVAVGVFRPRWTVS